MSAQPPHAPCVRPDRVRLLSSVETLTPAPGGVVYWMSRDQRVQDNWALLHARDLALQHDVPLSVVFCLVPHFLQATIRQYGFMLRGLEEVEAQLAQLSLPFTLLRGWPAQTLPQFARDHQVCAVVTDFSPLRVPVAWKQEVVAALPQLPVYEVDAHNVVPVWSASPKQEVGARTLRPKITSLLPLYLKEIPALERDARVRVAPTIQKAASSPVDWKEVRAGLTVDQTVPEVDWCTPGPTAALAAVEAFCEKRLRIFADKRNDPNTHACSDLSPYLHFGHLSAQRMALLVKAHSSKHSESVKSFLEESIVRRELADNFCFYQPQYDSLEGAAGWARESLALHAADPREHVYSLEQLEAAKTHEDVWNAAQRQMVQTGKMHGFMRMYWAKKILEWSPSPEEALRRAIYLNDRYELDGRDPNGYVGCAWSVMGTHDMGWTERPIFGKIRFMNYAGCKRKFDIAKYVATWSGSSISKFVTTGSAAGKSKASGSSQQASTSKAAKKPRKE
ncbi:hypothetical protein AB1Y20_000031 [Prymnesium parvum]|uniref:Deoxyribodipyrimidine photo-lyase n=1 Tax=Prymnesium parvum TaxID=97485 RepID=A0AB34K582_PRYPA